MLRFSCSVESLGSKVFSICSLCYRVDFCLLSSPSCGCKMAFVAHSIKTMCRAETRGRDGRVGELALFPYLSLLSGGEAFP